MTLKNTYEEKYSSLESDTELNAIRPQKQLRHLINTTGFSSNSPPCGTESMHYTKEMGGCKEQWGVLVPVGVKYGALQQTGRTAEERKEVKIDIRGERWQIGYNTHTHRFSQSLTAEEAMSETFVKE